MIRAMRIVRQAAFAAAAAIVAMPALAHADPVITPIVGALVSAGVSSAVATFVVTTAVNVGISASRARLFGKGGQS
ncbi:hypothetical protein BZG35_03500 [Brevundimonas sp. LM2]|uniref:hypothetical protein n=1 Tax=Brevundimonas sp. LM2 TaxID=1938605 RepID=UPI000983EE02|nr:hypothetical protein [Brevundimonas sp. LM2]AQR60821.1 hypothetical protein BZG35_03500 [Brevundimonas sp. LM2]